MSTTCVLQSCSSDISPLPMAFVELLVLLSAASLNNGGPTFKSIKLSSAAPKNSTSPRPVVSRE
uniref:Uncharacterized protein n=1 Tax=Plectus sambesii TaxID=2011161 RepID=A0A914VXE2_9BILA